MLLNFFPFLSVSQLLLGGKERFNNTRKMNVVFLSHFSVGSDCLLQLLFFLFFSIVMLWENGQFLKTAAMHLFGRWKNSKPCGYFSPGHIVEKCSIARYVACVCVWERGLEMVSVCVVVKGSWDFLNGMPHMDTHILNHCRCCRHCHCFPITQDIGASWRMIWSRFISIALKLCLKLTRERKIHIKEKNFALLSVSCSMFYF